MLQTQKLAVGLWLKTDFELRLLLLTFKQDKNDWTLTMRFRYSIQHLSKLSQLGLIGLALIFLSACSNVSVCPPDRQLGTVSFGNNTVAQIPYARAGTITQTYTAPNGSMITLSANAQPSSERLCYNQCTEPLQPINPNSTCEYLASEALRYVFRDSNSSIVIDVLYSQEPYVDSDNSSDQDYVDLLRLGWNYAFTDQSFAGTIDISKTIVGSNSRLLPTPTTQSLNGQSYSNVIVANESSRDIYYSTSQGLIGFTHNGQLYSLQ